ncbi:MAG: hypothetical protein HY237_11485 [Acidobacteria bacterium]|nr:hypothetical protein [Acidobacteriota bacterium]
MAYRMRIARERNTQRGVALFMVGAGQVVVLLGAPALAIDLASLYDVTVLNVVGCGSSSGAPAVGPGGSLLPVRLVQ